jgi:type I restriction enzyme, S subunit
VTLRVHPDEIVQESESALLAIHSSWERTRLADVADVLNGFAFKSVSFSKSEGVPLLRIRDVGSSGTETNYVGDFDPLYLVEPGNIVVGMDGDFRVARWTGPTALLNQRVCKISVRDEGLYDAGFLFYALPGYLDAINALTSSVTVKHLSSRTVQDIPLPLPPLAEQWRIKAAIEEQFSGLDAADEYLRRARQKLDVLRTRAVEAAFAGDWRSTTLGEIAEIVGGVAKDAKRQSDPSFVEVPYLRVANVQRGFLNLTEVATIRVPSDKAKALELRAGDVLFNEGGDRDKLGRGWVWSGEIERCIHQNHVFRARLRDGFEPKFVSWHGNTFGRRWFEEHGRQTTNLASLNLTTLKSFPVPAPPVEEQRSVVAEIERQVSIADAMATEIDQALRRSAALRRSILEQAFSGKLVPQDPSDEPASVLLERITASRPAAPKPSRRKRRIPA